MRSEADPSPEYKMVLVIRGELRLTPGKVAVQVAHAAVMLAQLAAQHHRKALDAWRKHGQKKIALIVSTLDELEALRRKAMKVGLPTVMVEDAGLTEVAPGTKTCLGVGPAPAHDVDSVTGGLPLL